MVSSNRRTYEEGFTTVCPDQLGHIGGEGGGKVEEGEEEETVHLHCGGGGVDDVDDDGGGDIVDVLVLGEHEREQNEMV